VKRFLLALILLTGSLWAQPLTTPVNVTPDCLVFFDLTAAPQNGASFDNRFIGCDTWNVSYTNTGFTALSLAFQDAPDVSGVAGTFVAYAGTVVSGVNPNVAITQASTNFKGYYPWLRVQLATVTGSGRVRGVMYGYRAQPVNYVLATVTIAAITANQGTANTAVNRWPVYLSDGANAQGVVGNPFFNRLSDGAAAQGVVANPLFSRLSDGANAQGTQTNPLFGRLSDGTNPFGTNANPISAGQELYNGPSGIYTPLPACLSRAAITLAGAGTTEIIALSGALQIRICHLSLGLSGATNITVVQGTGANCATGPADITGAYQNILGLALDFEGRSIVTAGAGQAVCITNSAAVTGGGFVTYTQY